MMAGWLSTVPAVLGVWSVRLLDVSWQAGLLAAAAWVACRVFPRMPAHVRAALWWLVCAKFAIGLAWTQPIPLPVLPADTGAGVSANAGLADDGAGAPSIGGASSVSSISGVSSVSSVRGVKTDGSSGAVARIGGRSGTAVRSAEDVSPIAGKPAAPMLSVLGGIWICGALLQLALTYLAYRRTHALVRASRPADASIALLAHELHERIGGTGRVAVRTSAAIDTPRVTGAFSPIILLPTATDRLSRADLEMTLCHELLHVRRGDLFLGWLPSIAQCAFFFHPFMWMAAREYALAREAACDAAVLRVLGAEPDVYGALLLRLGIAHTDIAPVAVGASSSFRTLKRRLIMLQHTSEKARAHAARWWILAAGAALLIVPLRLVAQSAPIEPAPPTPDIVSASIPEAKPDEFETKPPQSETKPAPDPWTALKSETWQAAQKLYNSTRDAWVLLSEGADGSVNMSGRSDDIPEARRQQERPGEPLLWFRHNGRAYVIRDPQTLRTVQQLFEPMTRLGDQQSALGDQQSKLGDQQSNLGDQQGAMGDEMSKLSRQIELLNADQLELTAKQIRNRDGEREKLKEQEAHIGAEMRKLQEQMEALGHRQEELGRRQEALGREQEKFGRQQGELGRQQEEAAKRAERQIREIMERAIATGVAKPAR